MSIFLDSGISNIYRSFAYNPQGKGRWMSLNLKKRKKAGGKKRTERVEVAHKADTEMEAAEAMEDDAEDEVDMDNSEVGRSLSACNAMSKCLL